jgi:2-methylisocitrate lyase-like PEP mutase family enzyme
MGHRAIADRREALPINVMVIDVVPPTERLSELGVARISYGATERQPENEGH